MKIFLALLIMFTSAALAVADEIKLADWNQGEVQIFQVSDNSGPTCDITRCKGLAEACGTSCRNASDEKTQECVKECNKTYRECIANKCKKDL